MAVFSEPPTFIQLIGADGLGLYVGLRDDTTDLPGRKNAFNKAYVEAAGLINKGFWRQRSFDYTASSTPALVDGTRAYAVPTTVGAEFDVPARLYYRQSGVPVDVKFVDDQEWVQRSAVTSSQKNYPQYARLVQTTVSTVQLELNRAINQGFIDAIGTLTLEYFITVAHLSANGDTMILPRNLMLDVIPIAAYYYAKTQGDWALVRELKEEVAEARTLLVRHDLTRTGRARQLRPTHNYQYKRRRVVIDYGMVQG